MTLETGTFDLPTLFHDKWKSIVYYAVFSLSLIYEATKKNSEFLEVFQPMTLPTLLE